MNISLDCIPCLLRQTLEAARLVSSDPVVHRRFMGEVLNWIKEVDIDQSPPALAQHIHHRLREISGVDDPYLEAKIRLNRIAVELLPELRAEIRSSASPLMTAVRIAIAGNMIDMGVHGNVSDEDVHQAMRKALSEPFFSEGEQFQYAIAKARSILYLADNAGEIVFDRLLIEQLLTKRITVAVRGAPVINDATLVDARAAHLDEIAEVIDNGSDAPGTLLSDCSQGFRRRFAEADLIIAKGQGNFESLNNQSANLYFLFKVKCPVIANHIMQPVGTQVLVHSGLGLLAMAHWFYRKFDCHLPE